MGLIFISQAVVIIECDDVDTLVAQCLAFRNYSVNVVVVVVVVLLLLIIIITLPLLFLE